MFLLLNSKAESRSSLHGPYIVFCHAVVLILMMRSDLGSVGTTWSLHSTSHTAFALKDELNINLKLSFPFVSMIGLKLLQYLKGLEWYYHDLKDSLNLRSISRWSCKFGSWPGSAFFSIFIGKTEFWACKSQSCLAAGRIICKRLIDNFTSWLFGWIESKWVRFSPPNQNSFACILSIRTDKI